MKAYYYTTLTSDLVRTSHPPLFNDLERELFGGIEEFAISVFLRFLSIKERYPDAVLSNLGYSVSVYVGGMEVYRKSIVSIDNVPVEIPDDDEDE